MPGPVLFNGGDQVEKILNYLGRPDATATIQPALEGARALHSKDPWLGIREVGILEANAASLVLVRTIMRQVAAYHLKSIEDELRANYADALKAVACIHSVDAPLQPAVPSYTNLRAHWDFLRTVQTKVNLYAEAQTLEERRLQLKEQYPAAFEGLQPWMNLEPEQYDLLQEPITFARRRGMHGERFSGLLLRFSATLQQVGELDWKALNEKATDLIEEFPAFVDSSTGGNIATLLEGLYSDSTTATVKKFAEVLQKTREEAERYTRKMGGLGSKGQSLSEWAHTTSTQSPAAAAA